jgi:hypothetical protein
MMMVTTATDRLIGADSSSTNIRNANQLPTAPQSNEMLDVPIHNVWNTSSTGQPVDPAAPQQFVQSYFNLNNPVLGTGIPMASGNDSSANGSAIQEEFKLNPEGFVGLGKEQSRSDALRQEQDAENQSEKRKWQVAWERVGDTFHNVAGGAAGAGAGALGLAALGALGATIGAPVIAATLAGGAAVGFVANSFWRGYNEGKERGKEEGYRNYVLNDIAQDGVVDGRYAPPTAPVYGQPQAE